MEAEAGLRRATMSDKLYDEPAAFVIVQTWT